MIAFRHDADSSVPQRCLILGGTRFIGRYLARQLTDAGHQVLLFHRGTACSDQTSDIEHLHGDFYKDLPQFKQQFERWRPDVVIHMLAYTERETTTFVQAFKSVAPRAVVISSIDVYRAYDGLRRRYHGSPDAIPLSEDAPLREIHYPYRSKAKSPNDGFYQYDKILVEQIVMDEPLLPTTVLRLPAVYGPFDFQHRNFSYLKRMLNREPAILMNADQVHWRWSRGYVENVAAAIALAATHPQAAGQIYNVADNDFAEADWVRQLGSAVSWQGEVIGVPDEQLPADLQEDFNWQHHWVVNISKIRSHLGYREIVPLDKALARTVAWERENPPPV